MQVAQRRVESPLITNRQPPLTPLAQIGQVTRAAAADGQRFLRQHMLVGLECHAHVLFVEVIRRRNPDRVDVRIAQHRLERGVGARSTMPDRERRRALGRRSGRAEQLLPRVAQDRREDRVGESSRADQPPSQANQIIHARLLIQGRVLSHAGRAHGTQGSVTPPLARLVRRSRVRRQPLGPTAGPPPGPVSHSARNPSHMKTDVQSGARTSGHPEERHIARGIWCRRVRIRNNIPRWRSEWHIVRTSL